MNKCQECGRAATHHNHTQFAGTHYLCTKHWRQADPDYAHEFTPIKPPTPTQPEPPNPHTPPLVQHLLDKLQEEAAEVVQAVSKIRRFGPHNHHPLRTTTNLQELVGELEDFQAIVWALEEAQYLDPKPSTGNTIRKYNTLMGD